MVRGDVIEALRLLAGTAGPKVVSARGRCPVRAADRAGVGRVAGHATVAHAIHDTRADVAAGHGASRPDPDAATVHIVAAVLAVGAAEPAARDGVVALDVAVAPARRRTVVHVVAGQAAVIFTDATAVDHVVAVQVATVAVRAALVAVRAVVAFAEVAARAAAFA